MSMSASAEAAPAILTIGDADGIRTLTMNRPRAYNSLSSALMTALEAALDAAETDPRARVLVIEGTGPGFSAGHDLKEVLAMEGADEHEALMAHCSRFMIRVARFPKPIIAKVHGMASAAGCQLVASCDLAIAASNARFSTPGVNIGLFCHTPLVALTRNVGRKHAMEMLLTGDAIDAETAVRFGLINGHSPADELDSAVTALAARIASKSSHVMALGKALFHKQLELDLNEAYGAASRAMVDNLKADDAAEGIGAFVEKRPPEWRDS